MANPVAAATTSGSSDAGLPDAQVLLLIQTGGGLLSLVAIGTLRPIATFASGVFETLLFFAFLNVGLSLALLYGEWQKRPFYVRMIGAIKHIGLVRATLLYDMLLLGVLVTLTGGSQESLFAPQFAALLPIAMLVPDVQRWKWVHASIFFLMLMVGVFYYETFPFSYRDNQHKPWEHTVWFLIFFFIFTCAPTIVSLKSEESQARA